MFGFECNLHDIFLSKQSVFKEHETTFLARDMGSVHTLTIACLDLNIKAACS